MPSTYTTNLGIEKIATGEQSGTWGETTNTNLDLLDEAVNGVEQVTLSVAGSSGSPNDLPITNGTSSDGRNKFIEFIDGGDLGATAFVQLTPNDAEKVVHIRNSLSADRTITIFQGTYNASNDFVIPNGADVVLKFDGAGAGAVVSDVFVNLTPTKLTTAEADVTTGNITNVNATTVDTTNVEVTNLKAKDGTASATIADSTGVMTIASSVLTTTDINGGTGSTGRLGAM
jgi:ribosomal protein L24